MLGNRNSQHSFAQVPDVKMARSSFDRSFTKKTTLQFDYLTPIYIDEIIPGDTCNLNVNAFARLTTQVVPTMDNMYIDFFFFFVPNRLVWTNWERFNGAQDDPGDSTDYTIPVIPSGTLTASSVGSMWDLMGLPFPITTSINVNALPWRAYALIWREWFRDQNLQDANVVDLDNGPDTLSDYPCQKRCKKHDYFTSCLPWPQKGTAINIPGTLASANAPVTLTATTGAYGVLRQGTDHAAPGASTGLQVTATSGYLNVDALNNGLVYDPNGTLNATVTPGALGTINQLREAFQIQGLLELDARGGTRYVEILQAHFNVVSPDFRLQRPEYLGGGEMKINSHVVPQTSPTSGSNPQAGLAAFATGSASDGRIGFTKSFVEHGYVIGMACPRADITYQQGLERMWTKSTRYDFFWPKLQEIGEQAVYCKELYCVGDTAIDNDVFGYQERYAEYRYKPSQIGGLFRSQATGTVDVWHLAEKFASQPLLNTDFIHQNTPITRLMAVSTPFHILADFWFKLTHARPMMTYSVPLTLGRF